MTTDRGGQGESVDPEEVARFSSLADKWWDPDGAFRALHKFNPVRLSYIRDHAAAHFRRVRGRADCLSGLSVLDVGCGGGILSEPMARLGAAVTGIDPSEENVATARVHAERSDLDIRYRACPVETLAEEGARFDIVLNMEVVEHVPDVPSFLASSAGLVKPDGLLFVATLNRTMKAFALAIVGAEYVLGWVPRGTHRWDKFLRPEEIAQPLERAGLRELDRAGVVYSPLRDEWHLSDDLDVNYMLVAARPA